MAVYISDNTTFKWYYEGAHYCLHVHSDNDPLNPRKDYDNTATMACWHNRYSLGDNIGKTTIEEFWIELVASLLSEDDILSALESGKVATIRVEESDGYDLYERLLTIKGQTRERLVYSGLDKEEIMECVFADLEIGDCMDLLKSQAVWLPLWLYDHSGITMSCGKRTYPYNDRWDSGRVGYIILTKDAAFENLHVTEDNWREKAIAAMESEVDTYDQYLRGEVYGYTLYEESADGEWTEIDSCWGFFGNDLLENGILDYIPGLSEAIKSGDYEKGTAELHTTSWYTF